ncbi:hypothetical protein [Streptomyces sp. NPDC101115]|uniref:hypothetical protein n=1 Tax=Streptomyces sp. NPDC101115 TaxID=3366106 RepID=UPI0037FDA9A1
MHNRRALATVALLLTLGSTACSSGPTYDESVKLCHKALVERPEGATGKPKECEPLKADDYDSVNVSATIDRLGWTDENGNFDKNKMLEDTLDD